MHKNLLLLLIILSFSFKISFGQEQSKSELIPPEEFIEDYDFMLKTLEETHPNLYAYIPKEEFVAKTVAFRESIDRPISVSEFYKVLYKTIALIKQGHTMVFGDAGFGKFKNE